MTMKLHQAAIVSLSAVAAGTVTNAFVVVPRSKSVVVVKNPLDLHAAASGVNNDPSPSKNEIPFYADVDQTAAVPAPTEGTSSTTSSPPSDSKSAPSKKSGTGVGGAGKGKGKKGAVKRGGKEGVFSPVVQVAKGVIGDEKLNKIRGKAISMHSEVISGFVDTAESNFGQAVLKKLFEVADRDGNGSIDEDELLAALQTLGFDWIKEKQVRGIFARADKDENGCIDYDEWMSEAPKTLRTNLTKLAKKNGGDMGLLV